MIARGFTKSTRLFIPKRGISVYSPVIENVNHDTLLNKLRCNNLNKCNCVHFVHTLTAKEIEQNRSVWLNFIKSHHKWCPVGPPGTSLAITQEEEEAELQREIMKKEMYYYDLDDVENKCNEEPITQEEEEAELQRELMEKDIYYYNLDPIENAWDEEILMCAA